MIRNKYCVIIITIFFTHVLSSMEPEGMVTRARGQRLRAGRDRILAGINAPVHDLAEESKQNLFNQYWQQLLYLKSEFLLNSELWAHRSISSFGISLLCTVATCQAKTMVCQLCCGCGMACCCLCGVEACVTACKDCKNRADTTQEIEDVARLMEWKYTQ